MSALMAAAGASQVVGSIFGAFGANSRAKAIKKAVGRNIKDTRKFTKEQLDSSDKLAEKKQDYLEDGDPFSEMGKFIFGDPSKGVYENLRKSQSDMSELAAGNTSGFSKEVASIVQGALSNTFGGPKGSFENLSAKNLFSFRQGGLQSALNTTNFFNQTGSQLTNAKFGILDQTFERQLALNQNQLNVVNAGRMQKAEQSGVGAMGVGNVLNSIGGALSNFGAAQQGAQSLAQNASFNNGIMGLNAAQIGLQYAQGGHAMPEFLKSLLGGASGGGGSSFNGGGRTAQGGHQTKVSAQSSSFEMPNNYARDDFGGTLTERYNFNNGEINLNKSSFSFFDKPKAISDYLNINKPTDYTVGQFSSYLGGELLPPLGALQ